MTMSMPPLITCPNCGLPYYQVSGGVHVCSEYRKGVKTMKADIECQFCDFKGSFAEGAKHRNDTGHLIRTVAIGDLRRSQNQATEHEPAARGEGGTAGIVPATVLALARKNQQIYDTDLSNALIAAVKTAHAEHAALVEQRGHAAQRIRELTEQIETLKTARRKEQRLHEELTWAAQAMVDAVLKGNPGREMIVKLAEGLSKRLGDYYRAKNEANAVEREQKGGGDS